LYRKVGSRFAEVLTFDINDPAQADANKQIIEGYVGKFVFDPFTNKVHKILEGGQKKTYDSIDEIPETDITKTSKEDTDKKGEKEGPKFKPENPYSAFPGTIKAEKQKTKRFKDQAESFSNLPGEGITGFGDI